MNSSWDKIRLYVKLYRIAFLLFIPYILLILNLTSSEIIIVLAIAGYQLPLALFLKLKLYHETCPACHKSFFPAWGDLFFRTKCSSCQTPIAKAPNARIGVRIFKFCTFLIVLLISYFLGAHLIASSNAKKMLVEFANKNDPLNFKFDNNNNSEGVRFAVVEPFQIGIVELNNGSTVKFWFLSHHTSPDRTSYSIFQFTNGEKINLRDHFCCDVYFGEKFADELALKQKLLKLIKEE